MADEKISDLNELAEAPAVDDEVAIVDASAVETKRIKAQYLLSPSGRVNLLGGAALMSVWSQSDTNKGLGTLVYDNLAGGTFSAGDTITGATSGAVCKVISDNGTTTMVIGAATGTFQDNEQIGNGGGVTADVNGDMAIGIANDPCNNDSTGDWTDDGANIALAFAAAEYTVTTNAATQKAWIASLSFTEGKLYTIEIDIKDGTAAGQDIECYFDDGAAQYGLVEATAVGWARIAFTFKCATTTATGKAGFRIPTSLGGNNIEVRRFSCYEITPCCTGAVTTAMDTYEKGVTCDIYREHFGANTKDGAFYSCLMVPWGANNYIDWPGDALKNEQHWIEQFAGKTITMGMWGKTSTANHLRIELRDGVGDVNGDYHTGGGDWEFLRCTIAVDAAATSFSPLVRCSQVSGLAYFTQLKLVEGSAIAEDDFCLQPGCCIWLKKEISSVVLNQSGLSDDADYEDLDIEADTDCMLPKGCRAVQMWTQLYDSGSAGETTTCGVKFKGEALNSMWQNSCAGLANNARSSREHLMAVDEVETKIQKRFYASGAGTLTIAQGYSMVQVN